MFQEVTRLISSVHDPQQVMDLVVLKLPKLMAVDAATIRLLDKATDSFVLGAACGVSDTYLSRATIDSREVMEELMKGRPTAKKDVHIKCDHDSYSYVTREGVKSAMSLPILYKNEVTGILRLLTRDSRKFSEEEIGFAMSLAEQVGVAISNSRMFQELENQVRFLSELREISRLVNSTLDLEVILQTIVNKLPQTLGLKGCTIRLLHPATNRLELAAASGLSETYLKRGSISRESSLFKVLKGEPVAIFDASNDPRVEYHDEIRREGIKSILAVPIKNESEIIGVLRLLTDVPRSFSEAEINFAVTMAEEGGNAIEKARTYRKITLLFNQIEEHEQFLQTILDSLWLQVLVVDPNQRVVMVNRVFLETCGNKEEQILGQLYEDIVPWRHRDMADCPVSKALAEKKALAILDYLQGDDVNEARWYERHLTPIVSTEGNVSFVIEAVRDITDQKLLEQEKMERMKLEGVVEMAGTAAHQINSPLFAALGTAQLVRDDLVSKESIEDIDFIIKNIKTIADLTNKMTKVTGFESRQYVGNTNIVKLKSKKSS